MIAGLALGCGRVGFDPLGTPGNPADGAVVSDSVTSTSDAVPFDAPVAACADRDLGSDVGEVASGSTAGQGDDYSMCAGGASPDVTYSWVAPATGTFRIDLCSSPDLLFDSSLLVLTDSCTGTQVACNDDSCGNSFHASVSVTATAGALYVIVVDGSGGSEQGQYVLSITQL